MTAVRDILWDSAAMRAATSGGMATPFDAAGISIDSRTITPGDLFIALRSEHGDGHPHVAAALAAGAAGAMVQRHPDGLAADAPLLMVADTMAGLTALARHARARFTGRLVAVTGSVGKTTTKDMLRLALATAGRVHAAEASHNNHWGVPLTLARLPPGAVTCVVEIGMNHAGEIAPLARLSRPDVAIITAIAAAHIGHLGSIEAIADEKASIAEGLRGGPLIIPADSAMAPRLRLTAPTIGASIIGAGFTGDAQAQVIAVSPDAEGSLVAARIGGADVTFRLGAPGRHMALNAVAALAAVAALGIPLAPAAAALAGFSAGPGRGARRRIAVHGGTALLLDESYNASSASVRAALDVLAVQPADRRIAVLGDMLELGAHSAGEHAGLAGAVRAHADLLFACGPAMRGLYDAVGADQRGAHALDSSSLAPLVTAAVRPGDAILVKGSLGSAMRVVVRALEQIGA